MELGAGPDRRPVGKVENSSSATSTIARTPLPALSLLPDDVDSYTLLPLIALWADNYRRRLASERLPVCRPDYTWSPEDGSGRTYDYRSIRFTGYLVPAIRTTELRP